MITWVYSGSQIGDELFAKIPGTIGGDLTRTNNANHFLLVNLVRLYWTKVVDHQHIVLRIQDTFCLEKRNIYLIIKKVFWVPLCFRKIRLGLLNFLMRVAPIPSAANCCGFAFENGLAEPKCCSNFLATMSPTFNTLIGLEKNKSWLVMLFTFKILAYRKKDWTEINQNILKSFFFKGIQWNYRRFKCKKQ